jgi:hypothetical protein
MKMKLFYFFTIVSVFAVDRADEKLRKKDFRDEAEAKVQELFFIIQIIHLSNFEK